MSMKSLFYIYLPLLWTMLFFSGTSTIAGAQSAGPVAWQSLETKHCIIRYQRVEDLEQFDARVEYSPSKDGLKWLFSNSDPADSAGKLARKVDSLFERVQEILDMRKKMKRVKINLYSSKRQLAEAYQRLFKKTCGVRSWYLYELKTIYANISDIHAGMLAHEMGHHIVDHYLIIRPPRATSEILARYVDKHLHDEVRKY